MCLFSKTEVVILDVFEFGKVEAVIHDDFSLKFEVVSLDALELDIIDVEILVVYELETSKL